MIPFFRGHGETGIHSQGENRRESNPPKVRAGGSLSSLDNWLQGRGRATCVILLRLRHPPSRLPRPHQPARPPPPPPLRFDGGWVIGLCMDDVWIKAGIARTGIHTRVGLYVCLAVVYRTVRQRLYFSSSLLVHQEEGLVVG